MNNFENVVGQDFAKKLLISAVKNNRLAHAYLFVGPSALGKFKLAVEFAKILQCGISGKDELIESADRCVKIESGIDPDVLLIDPGAAKSGDDFYEEKAITVDDIRKLEHHLSLFPYYSKYKIAIVRGAHKFTTEAVNAFLKTLEEPRGNSLIILVADNIHFLPQTLISRTQVIRFWPVKNGKIRDFLIKEGAEDSDAEKIASISGGKAGIAVNFLKDKEKFLSYDAQKDSFIRFLNGTLDEKFAIAEKIAKDEEKIGFILETWLGYSRGLLVAEYLSEGISDESKGFGEFDNNFEEAKLVKFVSNLGSIINLINNSNVIRRLALENLALEVA